MTVHPDDTERKTGSAVDPPRVTCRLRIDLPAELIDDPFANVHPHVWVPDDASVILNVVGTLRFGTHAEAIGQLVCRARDVEIWAAGRPEVVLAFTRAVQAGALDGCSGWVWGP